jgi:hypothetical protein
MDQALLTVAFVVLFLSLGGLLMVWHFRRSGRMVERWAADNGYRLLGEEYRWFLRGPFWWRTGNGMAVYHVTVQDASGRVREGYVRCGGWFLGLLSDQVAVEWED